VRKSPDQRYREQDEGSEEGTAPEPAVSGNGPKLPRPGPHGRERIRARRPPPRVHIVREGGRADWENAVKSLCRRARVTAQAADVRSQLSQP